MVGTYDLWLVILSIVVAVIASYVALDLSSRLAASQGSKAARYWLIGGAVSMGIGIWSMHFVGMLAFSLSIPISYDIPLTIASLLIAALVSGFALNTVSHGALGLRRLAIAGLLMGIGIASMHYTGMAAMRMEPPIRYDPLLFSLSILIAVTASIVALWISRQLRSETIVSAFWRKAGSALIMGAAITGMHYTGMAAANFAPNSLCVVSGQDIDHVWLAGTISAFTCMLLATTLLISVFDARLADRSAKHAEHLQRVNVNLETQAAELSRANALLQQEMQERVRSGMALEESEHHYRQLVEHSPDGIYIRREGKIVFVNSACIDLFGATSAEDLVGRTGLDLIHPDHRELVKARILQMKRTNRPTATVEEKIIRLDGTTVDVETTALPFTSQGKLDYQVVMRDISVRKAAEKQLLQLAQYDSLTGLPNRNLFRDRLEFAMARVKRSGQMLALMFLDLDRFKEINDTLGHSTGDKVLQGVAGRLSASLRDVDTVARLGGDEFTIILEALDAVDPVAAVAKKLKEAFSDPIVIEGRNIFVTVSIGVTLYPLDADTIEALLRTADIAMYHAKEEGRNTYAFYAPEMNVRAAGYLHMEGLLRHAVERQEFVLHYQPKVNVRSGRITGMEALIRWNSKELGLVPPGQFIPVAEENGLIVPISEWVLKTACAQNRAWQDRGFPSLLISVNLSPRQFREQNLVQMIASVLADTGLEPRFLELELTEGLIMKHADKAIATLRQLHDLGVQLSIDDFGTGYSSLAYLKRFPVQRLKIDQSFVRDLATDADDDAIVTAVIAMARGLKLGVIAEGVETREQLAFLANLNCDEYQGYYFSRPVPAEDFARLLQASLDTASARARIA